MLGSIPLSIAILPNLEKKSKHFLDSPPDDGVPGCEQITKGVPYVSKRTNENRKQVFPHNVGNVRLFASFPLLDLPSRR